MTAPNLPAGTPVWITATIALVAALVTFSPQVAKLGGPIGAAARWFQNRQVREIDRAESVDQAIEAAVQRRVDSEIGPLKRRIETLEADLERERDERREERAREQRDHRAEVEQLRLERDMYADYAAHTSSWVLPVKVFLKGQGIELPPPPWPDFEAFRREWLTKRGLPI